MKKTLNKFLILTFFFALPFSSSFASDVYFIDFTKVLNSSKAGAGAQKKLKSKYESEAKKFSNQQAEIRKEESEIIAQKKIITPEEYQKKVQILRNKVADLQKNKQNSINEIAKSRIDAKTNLLKAVKPIIKKYMENNNIKVVLDKKSVLMGDVNLEITDQIISSLNKELSSL